MKKVVSLMMAILIVISAIISSTALSVPNSYDVSSESLGTLSTEEKILTEVDINDNFREDEIIVVLNNSASKELKSYSTADFSELSVESVENLTEDTDNMIKMQRSAETIATRNLSIASTTDESTVYLDEDRHHQFFLLKLAKGGKANVIKSIKLLEQRDDVILAMPNYIEVIEPMEESVATIDEITASARVTTNTPNDYTGAYGQWGIDRISLPEAWNITTGSSTVIIGVMDSGIRSDHEDLSANIAASSYHKNCINDGTSALSDQGGHGTQVSGVIAAVGNNSKGTVGACWNIKLASLKVFSYNSTTANYSTSTNAFISAITYAKTKSIPIINYSAGGGSHYTDELAILLDYNGLFICAAGNDGEEVTSSNYYPPSYNTDNMIVVAKGSTNTNDALASDSNYSSTYVDLSAPGVNILTTDNDTTSSYIVTEGSSISAPYVTGVAALLKSKYPAMKAETIKYYIEKNVDKKTTLTDKVASGGRLNAYKALNNVKTYTVEYQANGGTGSMADTTVIYKNKTPLRTNSFTRTNYVFKGWNSYRVSDGKCYYIKGTVKNWFYEGQEDPGYTKYLYPDKATVSATTSNNGDTIIMTAQWAPEYEIVFNGNNASGGTMQGMEVVFGEPYDLNKNTFYRNNCTMTHWYAKKGNLMYYTSTSGDGWYAHGSQPSGYARKVFTDEMNIDASELTDISGGDTITMNAYWKPNYDLLGDFNMDGSINVKDATAIQENLSQTGNLTAYQIIVGDVNFSGSLSVKDVTLVQKYVARQISEFGA